MKRFGRLIGGLLIACGIWYLLHSDWLMFVMFTAWGFYNLIGENSSGELKGTRKKLLLITALTAIIGLIKLLW